MFQEPIKTNRKSKIYNMAITVVEFQVKVSKYFIALLKMSTKIIKVSGVNITFLKFCYLAACVLHTEERTYRRVASTNACLEYENLFFHRK